VGERNIAELVEAAEKVSAELKADYRAASAAEQATAFVLETDRFSGS
jgi:hypothetical protein